MVLMAEKLQKTWWVRWNCVARLYVSLGCGLR